MKKRNTLYLILIVTVMIALSTNIYAFMYKESPTQKNAFTPAYVDCEVSETLSGNVKTSITVKNIGNVDAYIRIRLVSYWINEDGGIEAKASDVPKINSLDSYDWIADMDNDTYYFKHPVNPEGSTENLLEKIPITLKTEDGYKQVVEVFAEVIQAEPETAAEESWPVNVESGIITSVK